MSFLLLLCAELHSIYSEHLWDLIARVVIILLLHINNSTSLTLPRHNCLLNFDYIFEVYVLTDMVNETHVYFVQTMLG